MGHNLFKNRKPAGYASYNDYTDHVYSKYPGGRQAAFDEASAYQASPEGRGYTGSSLAAPPQYWNRIRQKTKQPIYNLPKYLQFPDQEAANTVSAGVSWDAYSSPAANAPGGLLFKPISMHTPKHWFKGDPKHDYDASPDNVYPEEIIHSTQGRVGVARRGDYLKDAAELGAKLTQAKHNWVQLNPGKKITKDAAKEIMDPKFKKKGTLETEEGQKYLKDNYDQLLKFLMITAENAPRQQPGMFTGPERYA